MQGHIVRHDQFDSSIMQIEKSLYYESGRLLIKQIWCIELEQQYCSVVTKGLQVQPTSITYDHSLVNSFSLKESRTFYADWKMLILQKWKMIKQIWHIGLKQQYWFSDSPIFAEVLELSVI